MCIYALAQMLVGVYQLGKSSLFGTSAYIKQLLSTRGKLRKIGGVTAERLESSPLVLKIPGSKHSLRVGFFTNSLCSPSRGWVPRAEESERFEEK